MKILKTRARRGIATVLAAAAGLVLTTASFAARNVDPHARPAALSAAPATAMPTSRARLLDLAEQLLIRDCMQRADFGTR